LLYIFYNKMNRKPKIAWIGAFNLEKECPHWQGIEQACYVLDIPALYCDIRTQGAQVILDNIRTFNPDLTIFCLLDCFDKPLASRIRDYIGKDSKVAFWYVDLKLMPEKDLTGILDYFFLSHKRFDLYEDRYKIKKENMFFIQQACVKYKKEDLKFDSGLSHRLLFIGNSLNKRRNEVLRKINEYNQVKIIDGGVWEKKRRIYNAMPTMYNSSDYVLSVSAVNDWPYYSSNRLYCILNMNGLAIVEYFRGCAEIFMNRQHVIYFHEPEEVKGKIEYYNKNRIEANKIREQGFRYAQANHTYINRISEILKVLS